MLQAVADWHEQRWLKAFPHATEVVGHGDIRPQGTDCPGPIVRGLIHSGRLLDGKSSSSKPAAKPASKPTPPTGRRPNPLPPFPLPKGYYFGRDDNTKWSVSGRHQRSFKGRRDTEWIKAFANQLKARGWRVGKGQTWLSRHGNDGVWGDEYDALCRAFQADQKLRLVDGKAGAATWRAASMNPIT
jgi:hypothetical protein